MTSGAQARDQRGRRCARELSLSVLYAIAAVLLDPPVPRVDVERAGEVERLALRHEVRVLRRQVKRSAWRPRDRLLLAALSRCLPRAPWGRFPVRPETLIRWHRELVRPRWAAFGGRRAPGRPPVSTEVRALVVRMAREHPAWGYAPRVAS